MVIRTLLQRERWFLAAALRFPVIILNLPTYFKGLVGYGSEGIHG